MITFLVSIVLMTFPLNAMLKGQTGPPVGLFVLGYAMFHLSLKAMKE